MEAFLVELLEEAAAELDDPPQPPIRVLLDLANRPEGEPFVFAASSLGEGEHPEAPTFPYVVWNELPATAHEGMREGVDAETRRLTWSVYDEKGDYTRINAILRELRGIFMGITRPTIIDSGRVVILERRWGGLSGNLEDSPYNASVRYGILSLDVAYH